MNYPSAYLLVSHGSRDSRHQIAMDAIASLVAARLQACERSLHGMRLSNQGRPLSQWVEQSWDQSSQSQSVLTQPLQDSAVVSPLPKEPIVPPLVATAFLELHPLPLHEQIWQFAEQAIALGYRSVQILPLFLLAGVHVTEDIPAEVAIAQQQLGHRIELKQGTHIGDYSQIQHLIVNAFEMPDEIPARATRILLAHGSRRSQGNDVVESIASQIGAVTAYWSLEPSLDDRVVALINEGQIDIAVLPYFLFAGGITDAIAEKVEHLSSQFPWVRFYLAQPLGVSPTFADHIAEVLQSDHPNEDSRRGATPHEK